MGDVDTGPALLEDLEAMWRVIFRELHSMYGVHVDRVVIVERPFSRRERREALAKILFERLGVRSLGFMLSTVLTALSGCAGDAETPSSFHEFVAPRPRRSAAPERYKKVTC